MAKGAPLTVYDLKTLGKIQRSQLPEPCPIFQKPTVENHSNEFVNGIYVPPGDLYIRKHLIPLGRHYPTYVVWAQVRPCPESLAAINSFHIIYTPGLQECTEHV